MFDLCKGMGLLATIMYHTWVYWDFSSVPMLGKILNFLFLTILYATNEAFFLMAGYNLRKRPVKKMFTMSLKQTIKPYLISAACVVVFFFLSEFYVMHRPFQEVFTETWERGVGLLLGLQEDITIFGHEIPFIGVFWFILSFFWSSCVCNAVLNWFPQKWTFPVVLILTYSYWLLSGDFPYYCFMVGIGNVIFFYFGYLAKQKKALEGNLNKYLVILLGMALVYYVLDTKTPELWNQNAIIDSTNPLYYIYWLCTSTLNITGYTIWACIMIIVFVRLSSVKSKILDFVSLAGRYCMEVFFVHAVEFVVFPWTLLARRYHHHPVLGYFFHCFLRICLIAIVCVGIYFYKRFVREQQFKKRERKEKQTV